ncbi:hypothetical protein [Pseudomonas sp. 6D_7.1_Bac1]|uniref:hypothetical protein n=1 Tax=Pseudomonas sp. 6D_7.1_Bac1 TaxID=2971615 RepID=UPI0021C6D1D3|nr:hypothetical protein [Pseudomonas sp. 6D_7.1_Bac1]MCU1750434.1 hypothetical protein [Pseudomonas sp. 6D_7.1_Bac1]
MDYPKSAPGVGLVNGKFVDENPVAGTPGSLIPASWGNGVTEEILGVIGAAGLTSSESNNKQLLEAINKLVDASSQRVGTISGLLRNASFSIPVASLSGTFKADELTVQPAMGGAGYRLGNFNKTINLTTTGVGGMDTGSAPINGFVALYAIYNSATGDSGILAVNSTLIVAPGVYDGGRMPAGYNASALISVWATDTLGMFKIGVQRGRKVYIPLVQAYSGTATLNASPLSLAGIIPPSAFEIGGELTIANGSTTTSYINLVLNASNSGVGQQIIAGTLGAGAGIAGNYSMPVIGNQTVYLYCQGVAGFSQFEVYISSYSFH